MLPIRVLVVDDSVVVRRFVSNILEADPDFTVAGVAADGKIALDKMAQVNPDIVTLDIEMPVMDGLETLKHIRKIYPKLPVVMFSTLTERGAVATLDALSLGASDYVTKPSNIGNAQLAMDRIKEELIPKLKVLCGRRDVAVEARTSTRVERPRRKVPPPKRKVTHPVDIVTIGVSTGGPNALAEIMPLFPADFPAPILIVQHMPPIFTKLLADRLNGCCEIRVAECEPGVPLTAGSAWIAPGNYHMVVQRNGATIDLATNQDPPENSCRPSVDVMLRSVVETWGGGTLSVILTGMGQDGLRGCELVAEAGGQVLAQDEETSVVWGMPGFVAQQGVADAILPLDKIVPEILNRIRIGQRARPVASASVSGIPGR